MKFFLSLIMMLSSVFVIAESIIWSPANKFEGWRTKRNLEYKINDKAIMLTSIARDSSIISSPLSIDPTKFTNITIKYRATGIPSRTRGQIFYENSLGKFHASRYWRIPSLKSDGKWHTINLTLKNLKTPESWSNGGIVTRLRLDMMDQKGGKIEVGLIKLFSKKKPLVHKKISFVTKLNEPLWPAVKTQFKSSKKVTRGAYFSGAMIRSSEDNRNNLPRTFYLRCRFELSGTPKQAWLQYTADDSASVYLNGRKVDSQNNWETPNVVSLMKYLAPDKNLLAIAYRNNRSAGGVLAEIFIEYNDGTIQRINSDNKFKSNTKKVDGWLKYNFNDSNWNHVVLQTPPPAKPWFKKMKYINFAMPQKFMSCEYDNRIYKAGEIFTAKLRFKGKVPLFPFVANITLKNSKDDILFKEPIVLNSNALKTYYGSQWSITLRYKLPEYFHSNQIKLVFSSCSLFINSGGIPVMEFNYRQKSLSSKRLTSQIKKTPTGPRLYVNGQAIYPVWGGIPSKMSQRFGDAPLNLRTVYFKNGWWAGINKYALYKIDDAVTRVLRHNPKAGLIINFTLYPPADWTKKYREELARHNDGTVPFAGNPTPNSFSSLIARRDMEKALKHGIEYCENAPYRDRIIGYRVNGGSTIEWLGWKWKKGKLLDYSTPAIKGFQKFVAANYPKLGNVDNIPGIKERLARDNDETMLNPEKHLLSIAYNDYYSYAVADLLSYLCLSAKKLLKNRKIVGTYYGYCFYVPGGKYSVLRAHYALKKVIDSKAVDFLMSPQSYKVRNIGDTIGDMKPFKTLANNGIMSVVEDDTRTHNTPALIGETWHQTCNVKQTIAVMQRNAGIYLTRNQPIYFLALKGGSEFDFPEVVPVMNAVRKTGEFSLENDIKRQAEIAVVVSEESLKFLAYEKRRSKIEKRQRYIADGTPIVEERGGCKLTGELIAWQCSTLARIGAPVDYLLAEDLKNNRGKYKLWIFLNSFKYDDAFLKTIKELRKEKTTMLWLYAPGYCYNLKNSLENMRQLTRFKFKKADSPLIPAVKLYNGNIMGVQNDTISPMFYVPHGKGIKELARYVDTELVGLAEKKTGAANSIFCGAYQLSPDFLITLAKKAGVHIYTRSKDPMEANDGLFTLHAREAGVKTVKLPNKVDVVDIFNRKVVARNVDEFTFKAPLHSSWLFYYGKDADKLLKKLKEK